MFFSNGNDHIAWIKHFKPEIVAQKQFLLIAKKKKDRQITRELSDKKYTKKMQHSITNFVLFTTGIN